MKSKHLLLMLLIAFFAPWAANAQSLGDYTFSTGTDATKWVTLTSPTTLFTQGGDSKASDVTSIGFNFPFAESMYNQFSVNSDGNLRLGSTKTGTSNYTAPFNETNANQNNPKINALGCDGYGGTNNYVKYQLFEENLLVVEFNMNTWNLRNNNFEFKWQIQLHSNGDIEIVFPQELPATNVTDNHQCGMCVNSSDGWVIKLSDNTAEHFTAGSTTTNASGTWFDANRYYRFERPVIAYPKPTNLQVTGTDHESASFSWNTPEQGPNTLTGYAYQYKKASQTDWNDQWTNLNDATATTLTIHNLAASTSYDFRMKALYGSNGSDIVTTDFATTAQAIVVGDSWSDDFEGESCGWQFVNGTQTNKWFWGTAVNNGGSHALYISNSADGSTHNYATGTTSYVYATKLLSFADSKYTFEYNWRANGESSYDYLRVWLAPATFVFTAGQLPNGSSSGNNNYVSTTPNGWIPLDNTVTTGGKLNLQDNWQPKSITQNVTEGNWYLVFMWCNDNSGGSQKPAAVDNVSITRITCDYDVTNLEVAADPAPTAHTATINWSGDASQWEVAWSTSNSFPSASTNTQTVSATTINLENLLASSTYYVKVRAYCGGTDYGAWSSTIDFDTQCEAITTFPWEEKFENHAAGDFSAPCWSNTITSGSYKFRVTTSSNGSNATHQLYASYVTNTVAKLVFPEMTIPTGKTYQFIVDVYRTTSSSSYDDGIRVYASTDGDITNATELGFLYRVCTKTDNGVVTAETTTGWYTYTFDIPFTGSCHIILQGEGKGGSNTYVDNFIVRQAPDCATPTGLALTTGSETPEGATITWTAGDASSWIVEYKKSTEENYTAIAEPVNAPTYTFLGLDASTTYNVRVKVNCTTGDGVTFPTKPINFTTQQGCPAPKNLAVSGITANQAVLTWAPGYNETEWTVKYKKHADAEYTTADPVSTTPTITLSGLTGATAYDVQIIGCDPTHVYTVSNAFTTAYSVPFEEKFAANSIPTSWNNYAVLLSDDVLNGTTPLSGSGSWTFSARQNVFGNYHGVLNIFGTSCRSWLLTPNVTVGANHSLSFDLALTDYSSSTAIEYPEGQADDKFIVLISTNNGSTWTILRQWDNETGSEYVYNNIAAGGEMVYIDLAEYSGQTVRIAFYGESTVSVTGEDNDLHIDNVSIDVTPSCYQTGKPAASNVTNHSATLTWTPGEEGQTAWEIAYKNAVFDPNDPELDWTTVSTETINNNPTYTFDKTLDAATTYYVYVRAKCGNDYSKWCNNACNFTTKAAAPAPTALTTANVMPHSVDLGWTPGGGDYEVSWDIYYANSSTAPTATTDPTIAGVTENPYHITGLTDNKTYYFWVRANHSDAGASAWSPYKSQAIPEACPKPSALTTSDATPNSIKLSWTAGATWQTAWTVAYSETTNFDPTDETACTYVEADTNPFVVEGLDDNTTYYFRVKGNCGSEYGESAWNSYQASGKTLVACPKPTNVAVNNLTQNTADLTWTGYSDSYTVQIREGIPTYLSEDFEDGSMPEGWNRTSNYWSVGSGTGHSSYTGAANGYFNATCFINTGYNTEDILITPAMDLSSVSAATLSFNYWNLAWGSDINEFHVYYRVNNGAWQQLYEDLDGQSSWTTEPITVALTGLAANYQIGFSCKTGSSSTAYGYGIGIDDVKVYESSATVGEWTDATTEATNGAYTLTGLTYNTTYDVQVKGNCEGGTYSDVISFTTPYPSFTKTIEAHYVNNEGVNCGWYLIASPVVEAITPSDGNGFITDNLGSNADAETATYDLYYFDQTGGTNGKEWKNYRANSFNIVNGTGYLYASKNGTTLTFTGVPYSGNGVIELDYDDNASLSGWNLLGNPYDYNVSVDNAFYIMNEEGTEIIAADEYMPIMPMQGFFVKATGENQTVTFSEWVAPIVPLDLLAMNLSNSHGATIDRAIVRFDEGRQLPKFQLNENSTKVYIPQDGKDYAIINTENQGEMPINFHAEENGTYSLSFGSEEVSFSYLHLIDNMTGNDVDLLQTPSYTFNATTTDYESRFKLVFCTGVNEDSDSFAFCNNGNWIINNAGEATLQVIDVNGRILSSETVNGSVSKAINAAPGVYMLRLINGDNVKVQKIVVR